MKSLFALALLPLSARAAAPVSLTAGQSVILCATADYTADAAKALNAKLMAGRQQLKVETSAGEVLVAAPYAVSAPGITAADRESEAACVTVTKQ